MNAPIIPFSAAGQSDVKNHLHPYTQLRRLGEVSEVADLIEFLCSEKSSYITGAEIAIDGGQRV